MAHKQSKTLNPCISVPEQSSYATVCRQGMAQHSYQAVYFNCKQCMSPLTFLHGVWSRALGLLIERPKSFTMEALEKKVGLHDELQGGQMLRVFILLSVSTCLGMMLQYT